MADNTLHTNASLVADILARGGGTYSVYDDGIVREDLTTGYMVSRADREYLFMADNFAQHGAQYINDYLVANGDVLNSSGFFLGAWVDRGYVYLDVSRFYVSEDVARRAARENNQIAFYDNAAGAAVNTEDN